MKYLKFLMVGMFFGIIITKSQTIVWCRWQELFLLTGFHIMGVMATGIATGIAGIYTIKRLKLKDIDGLEIIFKNKNRSFYRYAIGGFVFGIGWAAVGCPGSMYALLGNGYLTVGISLLGALTGTYLYSVFQSKLPH